MARASGIASARQPSVQRTDDAGRREQHHAHHGEPEQGKPQFLRFAQVLLEHRHHHGADHGAGQRAFAAEQHHDDHRCGERKPEHLGADEREVVGVERAREARHAGCDHEREQGVAPGLDADRLRHVTVLADRDCGPACIRIHEAVGREQRNGGQRQPEQGKTALSRKKAGEIDERRMRNAGDAHRSIGEAHPVAGDQAQHLGEGERDDDEERSLQAQRDCADAESGERGQERGRRQRRPHRIARLDREQRGGVCADAEKRDVPERELADIADDEVQAGGQYRVHHHQYAEMQQVLVTHRDRKQRSGGDKCEQRPALDAFHARSARRENRP